MKHVTLILLVSLVCTLSSCTYLQNLFFSQKAEEARAERKKELPPLYLGTVHQVYPAQKFALLRIIGPTPRAGVTLISHPADGDSARMGNLVVSPDSTPNRGIVVADIRSGAVESGDRIFLYRNISRQAESPERQLDDVVVTESPTETPLPGSAVAPALPTVRPVAAAAHDTLPTAPVPQPATQPQRTSAEGRGVEVTAPPASMPQGTLRQPAMPNLPDKAPSYLDDIPNDINQWD